MVCIIHLLLWNIFVSGQHCDCRGEKNKVEQIVQAIKYLRILIVYRGQTEAVRY